jgi:hypothetical protein
MFIELSEIRELTSFEGVSALSDTKLLAYEERADNWIRRATNNVLIDNNDNPRIQSELRTATLLLIEYLWFWDDPETKIDAFSPEEQVKIGSYSYTKAEPGERTGIAELDSILESLHWTPNIGNIFNVSGPSRK